MSKQRGKKIAENKKQSERKTFRLFFVYAENVISCVYESSLETITDGRESYHWYINELLIIFTKCKIHLLLRQYKKVRSKKGKKFNYTDVKDVYTIVLFEKSPTEFHEFPDTYIHYF